MTEYHTSCGPIAHHSQIKAEVLSTGSCNGTRRYPRHIQFFHSIPSFPYSPNHPNVIVKITTSTAASALCNTSPTLPSSISTTRYCGDRGQMHLETQPETSLHKALGHKHQHHSSESSLLHSDLENINEDNGDLGGGGQAGRQAGQWWRWDHGQWEQLKADIINTHKTHARLTTINKLLLLQNQGHQENSYEGEGINFTHRVCILAHHYELHGQLLRAGGAIRETQSSTMNTFRMLHTNGCWIYQPEKSAQDGSARHLWRTICPYWASTRTLSWNGQQGNGL